jgi:hypothetical protein
LAADSVDSADGFLRVELFSGAEVPDGSGASSASEGTFAFDRSLGAGVEALFLDPLCFGWVAVVAESELLDLVAVLAGPSVVEPGSASSAFASFFFAF